jgi:hypothetical protein
MRRPTAGRDAAERRVARDAMRRACGRPRPRCLPDTECGLLAREPAQGRPANASGVTTGATVWITRLSVSSRLQEPKGRSGSQGLCRRPLQRSPLGCVARVRHRRRAPRRPAHLCPEPARTAADGRARRSSSWPACTARDKDAGVRAEPRGVDTHPAIAAILLQPHDPGCRSWPRRFEGPTLKLRQAVANSIQDLGIGD